MDIGGRNKGGGEKANKPSLVLACTRQSGGMQEFFTKGWSKAELRHVTLQLEQVTSPSPPPPRAHTPSHVMSCQSNIPLSAALLSLSSTRAVSLSLPFPLSSLPQPAARCDSDQHSSRTPIAHSPAAPKPPPFRSTQLARFSRLSAADPPVPSAFRCGGNGASNPAGLVHRARPPARPPRLLCVGVARVHRPIPRCVVSHHEPFKRGKHLATNVQ